MVFDYKEGSWVSFMQKIEHLLPTNGDDRWRSFKDAVTAFREHFHTVRMFHACRPLELKSYYEKGLLTSPYSSIVKNFLDLFSVPIEEFKRIQNIHHDYLNLNRGRVFLEIDRRAYFRYPHYFFYGSETLFVFAETHEPFMGRCIVREQGIPTILTVDVPVELLSNFELGNLVREISYSLDSEPVLHCCLAIEKDIPKEAISGHIHPLGNFRDQYRHSLDFDIGKFNCDVCNNEYMEPL